MTACKHCKCVGSSLVCAPIRRGLFSPEKKAAQCPRAVPNLAWSENRACVAGSLCLFMLKPGLVPSCLFSWPTSGDTRDSTPPTPPSQAQPDTSTSAPTQVTDLLTPLPRGLFAPRPSFKKGVLFDHSLGPGSCHQCH
ncbi:unnamed protein product [Pleuronectes platessa]|uniref:Uncharacterized protein n=1 Tax=Pleuronectes platessa TaxID=8262 RepID=A0A9N7Z604_PLEPL|nr:unnamed protein product [Pleuronectes platessa]